MISGSLVLDALRTAGQEIFKTDIARLTPLGTSHINVPGRYAFSAPTRPGCAPSYGSLNSDSTSNTAISPYSLSSHIGEVADSVRCRPMRSVSSRVSSGTFPKAVPPSSRVPAT